jgi:hypothetical protein
LENCDFSLGHWQAVLKNALEMGYRFCFYEDYATEVSSMERTILLRHDVDISLEKALLLAEAEKDAGVKATYFIHLYSRFYHPFSLEGKKQIRKIVGLGNEVGLHCQPQHYTGKDKAAMLAQDTTRLSQVTKRPVKVCSVQRSGSTATLGSDELRKAGIEYEAHETHFFKQVKYVSDSGGRWREGCLCRWLGRKDRLAVLTHPVWWLGLELDQDEIPDRLNSGD